MIQGFKEFIMRGNVMDLAVGVIIGAAFAKVTTALVDDFLNPLIGAIFGQPNFDTVGQFTLNGATIQPGAILTAVVNFLIVALALYLCIVWPMNVWSKRAEAKKAADEGEKEPEVSDEVRLLTEIRDSLAQK